MDKDCKDCIDRTIVNRSDGITYKFNAKEIYFGQTEGDILTLYEKENGQIIVVTDDKFYNQMRVEIFNDLLSFKKEFFKPDEKFSWFSIKNFKWFKESLLRKKVLPEEIKEL
jgi:hypothetical protein|nr:MAG TPA: hypothetical protein [Ackermannviridae sp.]